MTTSLKYASEKKGLGPGSLVHVGNVHQADTQVTLVDYGKSHYERRSVASLEEVLPYREKESLTWVIVEGLADAGIVEAIGGHFNIHPLVLEDILNTHQRPKFEEHEDYLFVVLKCLLPEEGEFAIVKEQVSLVIFKDFVFTFKEKADSLLDPVQKRLENSRGRIRSMGTDYLMYTVLDAIIDLNFDIMDRLEETLVTVEDEIFSLPTPVLLARAL